MSSKTVLAPGYYGGRFLKAGSIYVSNDPDPGPMGDDDKEPVKPMKGKSN